MDRHERVIWAIWPRVSIRRRKPLNGQPAGTLSLIFHASGEATWHRLEFWPFRDEQDSLIGILGLVRPADCSAERRRLRSQPAPRRVTRDQATAPGATTGSTAWSGSDQRTGGCSTRCVWPPRSTAPVLIVGEPGTGKRQVARTIHQNGPGRQQPLVPFDCEALPAEILERELFGADRNGATRRSAVSRLPAAPQSRRLSLGDGSTLLIREILMLPRDLQERLAASLDAPVRLLATTALDPTKALESEQLRPELYFALTTLVIHLQPLRERRDELPVLAQHLLERANRARRQRRKPGSHLRRSRP